MDDHLEGPNCPARDAVYFYCDYADPPRLQPVHLYRALLQQLFFKGLLTEVFVREIVDTLKVNINGLSEQKLTSLIVSAIESSAGLHVILDGLDECERDVQQVVTSTLCRFLTGGHPLLKVLITSRDEGFLLGKFENVGRLQVISHASAADIESYISYAVASSLSSGDLTIRNPALKNEIISKLNSKAQGMYVLLSETWLHWYRSLKVLGFSGYISK